MPILLAACPHCGVLDDVEARRCRHCYAPLEHGWADGLVTTLQHRTAWQRFRDSFRR